MRTNRKIDVDQLRQELEDAGINIRALQARDLGNGEIDIADQSVTDGSLVELPEAARAIIEAHIARVDPTPDYGDDGNKEDLQQQVVQIVQQLRGYLALGTGTNPAPTNAQTIGVIKILIRVVLVLLRAVLLPSKLPPPPPPPVVDITPPPPIMQVPSVVPPLEGLIEDAPTEREV